MKRLSTGIVLVNTGAIALTTGMLKVNAQSAPAPKIPAGIPDPIERTLPRPVSPDLVPQKPTIVPPSRLEAPSTPQPSTSPSSGEQFQLKRIEVLGQTVLQKEVAKEVQELLKKQSASFEELITLRTKITDLYLQAGYITSGAFLLNNQPLDSGIIQIQVVEGGVERIEIEKLRRLQPSYLRSRLAAATQAPLNRKHLEEALQLLQLDPVLTQINAELTAGSTPGQNVLRVQAKEAQPLHVGVEFSNRQSPSTGSIQGTVFASHDNFLGLGDRLAIDYGRTSGLDLYNASYSIPVNAKNGTFSIRYGNNDSKLVEDPFQDLDIKSESRTLSFNFRQPIVRRPQTEFAVSLGVDFRRSQTFVLDNVPFSFSEGPENGKSKVTALRLVQDWVNREPKRVLAARSQFSFGIDAFDATVNQSGTDAKFFAWVGQFQWVQQITPRAVFLTRIAAQLSPDSLLSLEKFSIGGVETIRGYRQNQLVSDNGVTGSMEVRLPLTRDPSILQLTPFFDIGGGWNNRNENPDPNLIASLGLGLQWRMAQGLDLRLDYGVPLVSRRKEGTSLQDNGLSFSLRYQPF